MKTQHLLVTACLLAGSNAFAAAPLGARLERAAEAVTAAPQPTPCQITFQKIKDLQKKNSEVCFIMSTLHANKKDAGIGPWVGYTAGILGKDLSGAIKLTTFLSSQKNSHEKECEQKFNCNKGISTNVRLEGPNKLHVTFYWTSGTGEQHDFEMTCNEDFMFGVSKQNASLAAAFRVTSETCGPIPD